MSLHKAIASGREHRQPYRGSRAFDYSCHNHRSCKRCEGDRLYQEKKAQEAAADDEARAAEAEDRG